MKQHMKHRELSHLREISSDRNTHRRKHSDQRIKKESGSRSPAAEEKTTEENVIGKNIRRLRTQREMNQDMLAAELNLLRQTISAYERGVTLPDIYVLIAMADFFGVTVDELIGRKDPPETGADEGA